MVRSWFWVRLTPAYTSANHSAEVTRALRTRPAIAMSITAATLEVSVMASPHSPARGVPTTMPRPASLAVFLPLEIVLPATDAGVYDLACPAPPSCSIMRAASQAPQERPYERSRRRNTGSAEPQETGRRVHVRHRRVPGGPDRHGRAEGRHHLRRDAE